MNMKKHGFLLVLTMLSACGSSMHRFEVTGVDGQFCVPKTGYVAPDIWWIPDDAPGIPKGFSFGGCHRLKNATPEDRAVCALPKNFIDADVDSLQERRNRVWSELKKSADFDLLVNTTGVEYAIDPVTGFMVVSNASVESTWQRQGWAVWRLSVPAHSDGKPLVMRDGDELVAVCSKIEDYPGTDGLGSAGEYGCYRYVRGERYALDYRFISQQRVPTEAQMKALETALFDQVDQWKCSK